MKSLYINSKNIDSFHKIDFSQDKNWRVVIDQSTAKELKRQLTEAPLSRSNVPKENYIAKIEVAGLDKNDEFLFKASNFNGHTTTNCRIDNQHKCMHQLDGRTSFEINLALATLVDKALEGCDDEDDFVDIHLPNLNDDENRKRLRDAYSISVESDPSIQIETTTKVLPSESDIEDEDKTVDDIWNGFGAHTGISVAS